MFERLFDSIKKNRVGIALMGISSICVCLGQLSWKLSYQYGMLLLLTGFLLYFLGACVMVLALKFGSLSVLQPVLSLNYILTIILAHYILSESITLAKIIGIIVIITGVFLVCGGD